MKTYEVRYSEGLDPSSGTPLTDFAFPWLKKRAPRTEFRAVWNEQALSFSFEVTDRDLVLAEAEDPGEAALGSDRVEIFVASSADLTEPYYGAEMDPRGNLYDYRATYHRQFEPEWTFSNFRFRGEIHEKGYRVRGRFSMEELRSLDCLKEKEMIAGLYRAEFSHKKGDTNEIEENWISWVDPGTKEEDFHVPSSFGKFLLVW